ncbi:histamine N-methyltransferase B-like [Amphiura filiformis]|uniref:histamine N-methyltransferase B-like n=1 Tax=Amphiura filiformis TaxID=82378 RepID=UPI003B222236
MASMSTQDKGDLKSIFHDPDHYIKSFRVYAQASAKFQVLANWGENVFSEVVAEKLQVNIADGEAFRALGVGVGSGEMDTKMMCKLRNRYPLISNIAVEPAAGQIKLYQNLATKMAVKLNGITTDWRKQGLDEFRRAKVESGDTTKYHFISSIHSLYYVDDMEDTVKWLYEQLEDGGMMLIITVSDDSGFWRLWNRYKFFEDQLLRFLNSEHIREAFSKQKIPFINYRQKSRVDITDSFEEGNVDGQLKVDFLAHVVDFHSTASPALQQELLEYLGGPECSERRDGEVLFDNDWDAVIVTK